jgi:hypothetical protein
MELEGNEILKLEESEINQLPDGLKEKVCKNSQAFYRQYEQFKIINGKRERERERERVIFF